jgi:polysaccharide pyruvyl transferase WcaK-like protein/O-antigen/teichoic acid export membrane protein
VLSDVVRARGSALALVASNFVRAGSQWVLVWFVAVLGGADVVGDYSIALAVATPIFIVFELSLRNVYVTLANTPPFRSFAHIRLVTSIVALAVLALAIQFDYAPAGILLVVGLIKVVDSLADLAYGPLQKGAQLAFIAWTSLVNSAVSLILAAVLFRLYGDLVLALYGSLFGSILVTCIVFAKLRRVSVAAPAITTAANVWTVIRAGIPAGLAYASVSVLTYLPVYFLSRDQSASDVGVFAVLAYFVVFANLLYASVQQATLHNFVNALAADGRKGLLKYAGRIAAPLIAVGALGGAVTYLVGAEFIVAVFGEQFEARPDVLLPLAISIMVLPVVYICGVILLVRNMYPMQLATGVVTLVATAAIGLTFDEFTIQSAAVLVLIGTCIRAGLGLAAATWSIRPITERRIDELELIEVRARADRASVVGYYGMDNYGDDLFRDVVRASANRLLPGLRIRFVGDFRGSARMTRSLAGVAHRLYASNSRSGSAFRLALGLHAAVTSRVIVLGGGSVLWGMTGVREVQRKAAKILGTRFLALGVSIGPFTTQEDRAAVTDFVKTFDRLVVRDDSSFVLGQEMRPEAETLMGGDLAALYDPPTQQSGARDHAVRRIGFSVCAFAGFGVTEAAEAAKTLAAALAATRPAGVRDEVVIFALNNHRDSGDDALAVSAHEALSESMTPSTIARYSDLGVADTWQSISSLDALLAVRLHAAITAYLTSVPFALLEYHAKCTDFLDDVGQPGHLRVSGNPSSDQLNHALVRLLGAPAAPGLSPDAYRRRAIETYVGA